jgi:hypothetical protein
MMNDTQLAFTCFTIVLLVGIVAAYFLMCKIIDEAGGKEPAAFMALVGRGNPIRILTVLMITSCAAYLQLADVLSKDLIALFSGIAGFVLGGMQHESTGESSGNAGQESANNKLTGNGASVPTGKTDGNDESQGGSAPKN